MEFATSVSSYARGYGHWRFGSDNSVEEIRAQADGFENPEERLFAYNHGAHGRWTDIKLTWFPGEMETLRVRRTGTAARHMADIAEERAILGLPPLQADEVPVSTPNKTFGSLYCSARGTDVSRCTQYLAATRDYLRIGKAGIMTRSSGFHRDA